MSVITRLLVDGKAEYMRDNKPISLIALCLSDPQWAAKQLQQHDEKATQVGYGLRALYTVLDWTLLGTRGENTRRLEWLSQAVASMLAGVEISTPLRGKK